MLFRPLVLLVEDDASAQDIYGEYLIRNGFRVQSARFGSAAVTCAREMRPHLILMDLKLPGAIDGVEATRLIKADPFTASIPIIAVTGSYLRRDHEAARAAGCADVIVKPFPPEQLVAVVQALLRDSTIGW